MSHRLLTEKVYKNNSKKLKQTKFDKEEYDFKRDNYFKPFGLNIFKVADIDVKRNLSWVMDNLRDFIISEYGL